MIGDDSLVMIGEMITASFRSAFENASNKKKVRGASAAILFYEPRSHRCIRPSYNLIFSIGLNVSPWRRLPNQPSSRVSTQLELKFCLRLTSFVKYRPNLQVPLHRPSPPICKCSSQTIHLKCFHPFHVSSRLLFNPYGNTAGHFLTNHQGVQWVAQILQQMSAKRPWHFWYLAWG
jgi:hypothetical protein